MINKQPANHSSHNSPTYSLIAYYLTGLSISADSVTENLSSATRLSLPKCARVCYLGQVSVVAGQSEVQVFSVVVGDDPGEDGVLIQVVVRTAWREGGRHRGGSHNSLKLVNIIKLLELNMSSNLNVWTPNSIFN